MTMASDFEVEHYLDHQAEIFLERFDPLTYLYLSRVMDYFDPFAEQPERGRTRASWRVSFSSDWRFGSEHARDIARELEALGADARHVEIDSPWGHDSFLMEVPGYQDARRGVPGVGSPHARGGGVDGRRGRDHRPDAAAAARSVVLRLTTPEEVVDAIRRLAVRGAPAIGICGAFGVVLAARPAAARTGAAMIRAARPTAVNLAWAVDRVLAAGRRRRPRRWRSSTRTARRAG